MRHENGLYLDSVCITTLSPDVRPEYYFIDTTNIPTFDSSNGCTRNYNGIKDVERNNIALYPNPATEMVNIGNLPEQVEALVVYSMTGERMSMFATHGRAHLSIPVANLSAGVYILNAVGNNYSANTRMVVVR